MREGRLGRKGRQASVAFKFQRFSLPEEQTKQVILLPSQENDTTFFFPDNKIHGKWNGVIIFSISNFYCNPWPNIYVCLVLIHNPSIYCSEEIRLKRHLSSSRPPRAQAVLPLLECPVWEVRQTDCRGQGSWLPNQSLSGGPITSIPQLQRLFLFAVNSPHLCLWPTSLSLPTLFLLCWVAILWLVLSVHISTITTGVDPDFVGPELGGK